MSGIFTPYAGALTVGGLPDMTTQAVPESITRRLGYALHKTEQALDAANTNRRHDTLVEARIALGVMRTVVAELADVDPNCAPTLNTGSTTTTDTDGAQPLKEGTP